MIGTVVPSVGVVGRGTTLVLIDDGRKIVAAREHAKRITFCKRGCGGRWGGGNLGGRDRRCTLRLAGENGT